MKYGVGCLKTALALIALAPALAFGLSGGYVFAEEASSQDVSAKETPPAEFPRIPYSATALTLEGETVSLEAYKGKLVFLTVWRTDCKACISEIPILNRLQEEFASDDFTVLGLSFDRDKDELVKRVIEVREINYPVWLGYDQPLAKYTATQYLPTLFAIGPGGELLGYMVGAFQSYEHALAALKEVRMRAVKSGETE